VRKLKIGAHTCETRSLPLPGATGIEEARKILRDLNYLSDSGIERLLGIYGGRASEIAALAADESHLAVTLDDEESVIAAEVVFALRHEFAVNLTDIVHRRLMIGLSADLGQGMNEEIAELAADELNWSSGEKERQLADLQQYNARLNSPAC